MQFFSKSLVAVVGLSLCSTSALAVDPVKVFILAGQSNTEGKGTVEGATTKGTLRYMVNTDPANYGHLVDGSNNWITRSDVRVYSTTDGGEGGGLTVGYGSNVLIGPELGFGTVIGNLYSEKVLIIKTAWGGKSLAVDFLSPTGALNRDRPVGEFYDLMLSEVDTVLNNLGAYVPGYAGEGYELKGFGWHQGYNDRINSVFATEYEQNMKDFINDVRFDLGAADLPFVIGTTSMGDSIPVGSDSEKVINAQKAMADPAKNPLFAGNVATVDTRPFWRTVANAPADEGYHWNRSGETFYLIGDAMGDAMATMSSYEQFEAAFLEVNQQTGEIKLINPATNLAAMDLKAISITSAVGALDTDNWQSIAGNYDGNGNSSVDSGNWTILTSTTGQLSESAVPGGADGSIAINNQVSLGTGTWVQNPTRDLLATYTDTAGTVRPLNIRYTGLDILLGDLNANGSIGIGDWDIFVDNILADMTGLSPAQAYQLGDLDGDYDNDLDDFDLFRKAYELNNPQPGAFAAMLERYASIPEPSSAVLLGLGLTGLMTRRRRGNIGSARRNENMGRMKSNENARTATHKRAGLASALTLIAFTGAANAQEMFSVNLWSTGKPSSPSVWVDTPSNTATLTLEPNEAAGLWETTNWQNISLGNPFNTSTSVTTINGSQGSSAIFSMPDRRNSSPYQWNAVRNDNDTVHIGNATLLDAHAVGTEDPYDNSAKAILQVSSIPFAVYDVVIYLGINDGQKFSGRGTATFDGVTQNFTMPITEPTGVLTRILNETTPGNYLLYENVTGSSFTAEIFGEAFTHLGPAGFQIREVVNPAELKIQVDTGNGTIKLMGDDSDPLDINYYQITSSGNSMNHNGWNSLADQDLDGNGPANGSGNGWEEGGSSGAQGLAEAYLLGNSTIAAGAQINLGNAYNYNVNAQDLVFRYRSDTGQSFFGDVEYVTSTAPADLDFDGDVDDADFGIAFAAFTGPNNGPSSNPNADLDLDGDVDDADFGIAFAAFTGPGGGVNVPEPATGLMLLALGGLGGLRRKNR